MSGKTIYIPYFLILLIAIVILGLLFNNQFFNRKIPTRSTLPFKSVGDRGNIYFAGQEGKTYLAAANKIAYDLIISPLELEDIEEAYEHINEETPIDRDNFLEKAAVEDDEYELLKRDITEEERNALQERIDRYGLAGVWLERYTKRTYPYTETAAQVIGFVPFERDEPTRRGQYGIENIFDDILSVGNQTTPSTLDIVNEEVLQRDAPPKRRSGNILLTINLSVQQELEKELANIESRWGADLVGGIVMDPHTGAIVAMGSSPSFDPNTYSAVDDFSLYNNPNIENVYEMGSVFKALTIAIGLDSGGISKDERYNDRGSLTIDNRVVSNYDGKARGPNTPIQQVLTQSLNIGAVYVLQETGIDTYKRYIDKFRFGGVTGIDLPKEISGIVGNLESNRTIEFATASYGQGIAVTPIAAIRAFATLANGGVLVQPYVVQEVENSGVGNVIGGTLSVSDIRERQRIFDSSTTKEVTELLINTFDKSVLNDTFNNSHYSVAAKTGTAQLVNERTGGYYEDRFLHSFFGYFPANNPEFIVFLFAVDPQAQFASQTLARPFNDITNFIISHYGIRPDR